MTEDQKKQGLEAAVRALLNGIDLEPGRPGIEDTRSG